MTTYRSLDEIPLTVTVDEMAKILRIGRNSAYQMVRDKRIASFTVGRKILIPRNSLIELLTVSTA